jgi:hypothetical protein
MSAFVLLLAAGLTPGNDLEKEPAEVAECLPARGAWRGTWTNGDGIITDVALHRVVTSHPEPATLFVPVVGSPKPVPVTITYWITDEGRGNARLCWRGQNGPGIYTWKGDCLLICFRSKSSVRPTSFYGGDGQNLLILRCFEPRK